MCKPPIDILFAQNNSQHWGQPHEATVVKMAPTRPLASRSFCLLVLLCDHRSLSNLQQRNTEAWCTLHQNDRLVYFSFLYNDTRKIRRETTVGKFVPNNGRRQLNWVTTVAWGTTTVVTVAEKPWDYIVHWFTYWIILIEYVQYKNVSMMNHHKRAISEKKNLKVAKNKK